MLILAIDTALDACAAGIGFAALDRIAVTTGPGRFTGLRVEPRLAPDIAWVGRLGGAKTQKDMLQKAAQPSVP